MSSDLQCLDSTSIDRSERLWTHPYSFDSRLNHVFIYVAQEVTGLLQPSLPFGNNSISDGAEMIAIRAIEPEFKQIMTVEPLTARELEVLQLIVEGYNNSTIAGKLYITKGTVKTHVRNVLRKLCVEDRTQAAIRARSALVLFTKREQ